MQFKMDMIQEDGSFSIEINEPSTHKAYRPEVFEPGQFERLKELPQEIQEAAMLLWTPEIIATWKSKQAKTSAEIQSEIDALPSSAPVVTSEQRMAAMEAAIREMAGEIYG